MGEATFTIQMMSQWVKTLVPQWGIEPWSLIIWEGSEPLEHQDVITFTPKRKHVLKLSENTSVLESHIGYQMSQWVKTLVS